MRRNIFRIAIIIALCAVHGAEALSPTEQLNLSRAFTLAEIASPEQLKQAVAEGINFNIERHLNFDDDDDYGWYEVYEFDTMTPLHAAAIKNHNPESIRFLLSLGLDVNALAETGNTISETPLVCAISNKNNIQVINALLSAGADPKAWGSGNNYSVFHLIASECRNYAYAKAVIDALIQAGGDVNSHYNFSREEIKDLYELEDPSDFRIVWSRSAPFGDAIYRLSHATRGNFLSSFTPLMYAVLFNNPDVVNILLDVGADPRIRSLEGKTALDYAKMLPKTTKLRRSDAFIRLQKVSQQTKTPPSHN